MVWLADLHDRKPKGEAREKLLKRKAELETEIKALKAKPVPSYNKEVHLKFLKVDLEKLAREIIKIQAKLDGK